VKVIEIDKLKLLEDYDEEVKKLDREVTILQKLKHKTIVRYYIDEEVKKLDREVTILQKLKHKTIVRPQKLDLLSMQELIVSYLPHW
jgi:serine/threonine protein kinase